MGERGSTVTIDVLFFAKSREIVGTKRAKLDLPSVTSPQEILKSLVTTFSGLSIISNNILLSLNEEYLEGNNQVNIKSGDELAVIPPISGG